MTLTATGLIADIGATNTRFALVAPGGAVTRTRVFASDDFASLREAIDAYLAAEAPLEKPAEAVLAVAAPVTGDKVTFTNHPWSFSIEDVRKHFGFAPLRVINDFAANALAVLHLTAADRGQIGGGTDVAGAPIGVIGPGSGLGVSSLIANGGAVIPIQGEGVCELAGEPAAPLTPAQITDRGIENEYPRAREAMAMFCAMLGTVAGNLALTLGARGGIYIAGGIVPKLGAAFAQSPFRVRFEAKGRYRGYLAAIPTYVITHPSPALLGAATLLQQP